MVPRNSSSSIRRFSIIVATSSTSTTPSNSIRKKRRHRRQQQLRSLSYLAFFLTVVFSTRSQLKATSKMHADSAALDGRSMMSRALTEQVLSSSSTSSENSNTSGESIVAAGAAQPLAAEAAAPQPIAVTERSDDVNLPLRSPRQQPLDRDTVGAVVAVPPPQQPQATALSDESHEETIAVPPVPPPLKHTPDEGDQPALEGGEGMAMPTPPPPPPPREQRAESDTEATRDTDEVQVPPSPPPQEHKPAAASGHAGREQAEAGVGVGGSGDAAVEAVVAAAADGWAVVAERVDCATVAPCGRQLVPSTAHMTCVSFHPARFWHSAATQRYLAALRHHQARERPNCWYETEVVSWTKRDDRAGDRRRAAAANRTDLLPLFSSSDDIDDSDTCTQALPATLVYWHNFKVGGTTARHALYHSQLPRYQAQHLLFSDIDQFDMGKTAGDRQRYQDYANTIKQQVYQQQQQQHRQQQQSANGAATSSSVVGFTFVRSPVQRFLSGLAQIERMAALAWETSPEAEPCFAIADAVDHGDDNAANATALAQQQQKKTECVVDHLLSSRVFFNLHLYPQAYLLDAWTQRGAYDTAVTILPLSDMDDFIRRLTGRNQTVRSRASNENESGRGGKTEQSDDAARSSLLESDLEPRVRDKICRLYAIDVVLLRVLGMDDPVCDPIVSAPAAVLADAPNASTAVKVGLMSI